MEEKKIESERNKDESFILQLRIHSPLDLTDIWTADFTRVIL